MSKKQQDLLKAKQKKQKMIVAVGGILLVGLLAFQLPRTMKMLSNKPAASESASSSSAGTGASSTATTGTTTTPSATAPIGGASTGLTGADTGASGASLSSDPLPAAQDGQLVSFDRFAAKDPFDQQIDPNAPAPSSSGSSSTPKPPKPPATTPPTPPAAPPSPPATTPATTTPATTTPTPPAPTPPPAKPTKATIAINGVSEDVEIGGTFPSAQPFFKLVSLTATEAKIAIAGGSLADGSATVALIKGKTLTLQNTADGTRYELQLVATS